MKTFVAILALAAVVAADVSHIVQNSDAAAQIVQQYADVLPDQYKYSYGTSNGISGEESGVVKNPGTENEAIQVQGSIEYTAPDGTPIRTAYTADENGYHPTGAHLPTPPPAEPIPDYILRALEYIKTHPPTPEPAYKKS